MLRKLKIAIAIGVAVLGSVVASADAKAGWGHHHGWGYGGWGHHHHGYYGGSWGGYGLGGYGWGYPSYGWGGGYSSLSINIGRPAYWAGYAMDYPRRYPYIYPGSLSSFGYYDYYGSYPSIFGGTVSSYFAPAYSSAYYAPSSSGYYGSGYYGSGYSGSASGCCAPVVASSCCDPCAGYPAVSAPATSAPTYVPDAATPAPQPAPSANGAPSVRSLLPNFIPSSNLTRAGGPQRSTGQGRGAQTAALLTAMGRDSVQGVSLAKPVMPEIAANVVPLSQALLQAADAIFASGDYQQAAAAYARLTVRYGNHDALAVRRFIALVASGDCEQAAVMFEAASAAQQPLLASALPAGGLTELYGLTAPEREKHVDYLAAYALKHPDDGLALAMVGTWLELDGQAERAQIFMKSAAAMAPRDEIPTDPAHLVATDISQ